MTPSSSSHSDQMEDLSFHDDDNDDDEGWEDAEPEGVEDSIVSLLDDRLFPDVLSMLGYCKDKYNFDFLSIRNRFSLDFYGMIKLVNFIRTEVVAGRPVSESVARSEFDRDEFLKPAMANDALLFSLDDICLADTNHLEALNGVSICKEPEKLLARIAELEADLQTSQSQFERYRNAVEDTLDARWHDTSIDHRSIEATPVTNQDTDSHYFTSYSYNDIHETMLKDTVRTEAYRDFIYSHKHLFVGKVVLDVGCGTGILSMFCARAGADRVIAVDNSAIIDKARENIFNNCLTDKIICLRGKVEEVSLPVDQVDVIVSEWMGYALLYEAMLDSVIWARNKYLKPNGLMIPSHVNLWLAPLADPDYVADHFTFWRDVYGFDMRAMQAGIHDDAQVLHMPVESVCADPVSFMQFNLYQITQNDVVFKKKWAVVLKRDVDSLDGFAIWFDIFFTEHKDGDIPLNARAEMWSSESDNAVGFTTGPFGKETHWRQAVLFISNRKDVMRLSEGQSLSGELEYTVPSDNPRALDIGMSWTLDSLATQKQQWKMR